MKPKKKRIGPVRNRRVWLERRAYELAKQCPSDCPNPIECPLHDLRPRPARQRRLWLHRLSDDELEYLVTYHTCCFAEKLAARRR